MQASDDPQSGDLPDPACNHPREMGGMRYEQPRLLRALGFLCSLAGNSRKIMECTQRRDIHDSGYDGSEAKRGECPV